MARIAGVDLPNNKHGVIGLTYIYGIGRSSASKILATCGIDPTIKVGDWNDDQIAAIRALINDEYKIEGELRSSVQMDIKRLAVSPCAARAPRTTPVPARARRRPSPTRRRPPSKD